MEQYQPKFFELATRWALEKLGQSSEIILSGVFSKKRGEKDSDMRLLVLTSKFLVYYEVDEV
jgi:hypothetical protein